MFTVGVTGGIGSGKSTVAGIFSGLGVEVVDADLAAREVVAPPNAAFDAIRARYGKQILTDAGLLDRASLRKLIFADEAERAWLEDLLHPLVDTRIRRKMAACESAYCMLVSPLLLETRQHRLVDRVLVIDVCRQTQLRRSLSRDQSERATIEAIIDAQASREQRLGAADDVLENEGPRSELTSRAHELHARYLTMAKAHE